MSDEVKPEDIKDDNPLPDYSSKARLDYASIDIGEMMDMQTKWLDKRLESVENFVKDTLSKLFGKENEK